MSDTPDTDSLVQRLAVDRLAAPGILDHHALQRAPEKFSHAANAHVLPRLHRRIEPTSGKTESLPLVRIDRSVDSGVASSMNSVASAGASIATVGGDVNPTRTQTQPGAARSFVRDLVARQTPGITRTSELVARRVAVSPGLIGGAGANARLLERAIQAGATPPGGLPSVAAHAVAPGVVQRVAMSGDSVRATAVGQQSVGSPHLAGVSATTDTSSIGDAGMTPMVMRRSSPTPNAQSLIGTTVTGDTATASPMPRVAVSNVSRVPVPLLSRKADAAARVSVSNTLPIAAALPISAARPISAALPIAAALPVTSASLTVAAAPAHLVLRKPSVGMPSQQPTHAPSITKHAPAIASSSTGVIARTPAASDATPSGHASTHGHDMQLDWIAEQVGHRLARRLEVERERMGVRQWRQLS